LGRTEAIVLHAIDLGNGDSQRTFIETITPALVGGDVIAGY
jgi:hypothetical protein